MPPGLVCISTLRSPRDGRGRGVGPSGPKSLKTEPVAAASLAMTLIGTLLRGSCDRTRSSRLPYARIPPSERAVGNGGGGTLGRRPPRKNCEDEAGRHCGACED